MDKVHAYFLLRTIILYKDDHINSSIGTSTNVSVK